jgi:hypothetical protein
MLMIYCEPNSAVSRMRGLEGNMSSQRVLGDSHLSLACKSLCVRDLPLHAGVGPSVRPAKLPCVGKWRGTVHSDAALWATATWSPFSSVLGSCLHSCVFTSCLIQYSPLSYRTPFMVLLQVESFNFLCHSEQGGETVTSSPD